MASMSRKPSGSRHGRSLALSQPRQPAKADTYQEQMQSSRSAQRDAETCREAIQCIHRAMLINKNRAGEDQTEDETLIPADAAEDAIRTLELIASRLERLSTVSRQRAHDAPDSKLNEPGKGFANRHADKRT